MDPRPPSSPAANLIEKFRSRLSPGFLARYQLVRLLGRGGMGSVFHARQVDPPQEVAIKFMSGSLMEGDDTEARFRNEAKALEGLSHPNLVQVLDSGKDGDVPFIVFEFIPGETLKDLLLRERRLDPFRALELVKGMLRGLQVAHNSGIIHRDIKAENILIDAQGTARVADFGIAKSDQPQHTKTGVIIGTPAYMAPEQAMGHTLTPRADIYSTGIVLFELLTGQLPFGEENSMQTMMAHIHQPVPAPSYLVEGLPLLLDDLVGGALAKAPADRYPSSGAFLLALDRTLDHLRQVGFSPRAQSTSATSNPVTKDSQTRVVHLEASSASIPRGSLGPGSSGTQVRSSLSLADAGLGSTATPLSPSPTGSGSLSQSGVRVLASTLGKSQVKAGPKAEEKFPPWLPAVLGVGLLILGIGTWSFFASGDSPEGPPEAQEELGSRDAEAVYSLIQDISRSLDRPERARVYLEDLPGKVPREASFLALEALRRLEKLGHLDDLSDPIRQARLETQAALGDPGSMFELVAGALELSQEGKIRALKSLSQGLTRKHGLSEEDQEILSEALWDLDPGRGSNQPDLNLAVFAVAEALGTPYDAERLAGYLERGDRQSQVSRVGEAAFDALKALANRGNARATEILSQNPTKTGLELSDDEKLEAIRSIHKRFESESN